MARGFGATAGAGSTDRLTTTYTTQPTAVTISFWWKDQGNTTNARVFEKNFDPGGFIFSSIGASFSFYSAWSTTNGQWNMAGGDISASWEHILITYDGSSTANDPSFYRDGTDVGISSEISTPAGTFETNSDAWIVGNRAAGDRALDGYLAEFAVWNRVLNGTEIANLAAGYHANLISSGLQTYIPMNSSFGTTDLILTDPTVTGTAEVTHPFGNVYINDASTWDSGAVVQTTKNANWADTQIDVQAAPDITGLTGQLYAIVETATGAVASRAISVGGGGLPDTRIIIPTGPLQA